MKRVEILVRDEAGGVISEQTVALEVGSGQFHGKRPMELHFPFAGQGRHTLQSVIKVHYAFRSR